MFIGAAVGGRWGRENPLGFEEGYGSDRGDPRWIAWYRHWRILQDLIEFQQVLLGSDGEDRSPQLRRQSLHYLGSSSHRAMCSMRRSGYIARWIRFQAVASIAPSRVDCWSTIARSAVSARSERKAVD